MIKPRLRGELGEPSRAAARATLVRVLDATMRLLHPVTPFITETVWQRLPRRMGNAPSIMVAEWPAADPRWEDAAAEARIAELQEVISTVRNLRAEYGVQPGTKVRLRTVGGSRTLADLLSTQRRVLLDLARVEEVADGRVAGEIGASAVLRSGAELFLPLEGVIDLERERGRLRGELERTVSLAEGARKRLENESFVSRAPAEVVEREREKLASVEEQRGKLESTLRALEGSG
jgi:valyl-tRNA synthetase